MIQEDVERRSIAISVTASKLTAQTLAKVFQSLLHHFQNAHDKSAVKPKGRQSVKRLSRRFDPKSLDFSGATKLFDRIVKENNLKLDYAFHKTGPKKYLLFFKGAQVDEITAAFSEYTNRVMNKNRKPSIEGQMRQAAERTRNKPREREKTREVKHEDR